MTKEDAAVAKEPGTVANLGAVMADLVDTVADLAPVARKRTKYVELMPVQTRSHQSRTTIQVS